MSDSTTPFHKADAVKNRLELIEPEFIEGLGRILTFGANKYEVDNWKKATDEDIKRIKGALLRHLMTYLKGDKIDEETGESHLYHAACNLMFLDFFDRSETEAEDAVPIFHKKMRFVDKYSEFANKFTVLFVGPKEGYIIDVDNDIDPTTIWAGSLYGDRLVDYTDKDVWVEVD